jgi:acetylxylan esterase
MYNSTAMMTNVLCATYPEIWRAASVYSGVAAGCFVSSSGAVDAWNSSCANGQVSATSTQWASVVRAMFPGYTGAYPPIQEYHGTADTTLFPPNLGEEIKEWSGIFGYNAAAPVQVLQNTPLAGYTKSIYGPNLQGISAAGVGHTVPIQGNEDMKWFGLVAGGAAPPPSTSVSSTSTAPVSTVSTVSSTPTAPPTTTITSSTAPPTSTAPGTLPPAGHWDQCGGIGWTGATTWSAASLPRCAELLLTHAQCLAVHLHHAQSYVLPSLHGTRSSY